MAQRVAVESPRIPRDAAVDECVEFFRFHHVVAHRVRSFRRVVEKA